MKTTAQPNEVMDLLDASEQAFEVRVGGQRVEGAGGLVGALAAAKEMMHGNVLGATEGEFTVRMRVRMDEQNGMPHLVVVHQDFVSFCPDAETDKTRNVLVVDGEPIVDRRSSPRPSAKKRAASAWGMNAESLQREPALV